MPSVTHPFPTAAGLRSRPRELLRERTTNRCEAAQICCGRIWDGRLEDSRRNLLRLEGLAIRLLSVALPYPQGPENKKDTSVNRDGAMLNAECFDFGLLARERLQRLHAR